MEQALTFILGIFIGAMLGVFLMCLLQINHGREEIELGDSEPKWR